MGLIATGYLHIKVNTLLCLSRYAGFMDKLLKACAIHKAFTLGRRWFGHRQVDSAAF